MAANAKDASEGRSLSTQIDERGINPAQWHTLSKSLFPGAKTESVLMVIDYCRARGLDPLKKPCHIVPMKVKDQATGKEEWRDVIMPGIYEVRTTAQKTGDYLGHSNPEYGEMVDFLGVTAPEWCHFVVYRWNEKAQLKAEYPVTVYFAEVCTTRWDKDSNQRVPNARWSLAPRQMLTKCAEAAALREAFPDELGGQMVMEEMDGRDLDDNSVDTPEAPFSKIAGRKILRQLMACADKGDSAGVYEIFVDIKPDEWVWLTQIFRDKPDFMSMGKINDCIKEAQDAENNATDPTLIDPLPRSEEACERQDARVEK